MPPRQCCFRDGLLKRMSLSSGFGCQLGPDRWVQAGDATGRLQPPEEQPRPEYNDAYLTMKLTNYSKQDQVKGRSGFDLTVAYVRELIAKESNACFNCGNVLQGRDKAEKRSYFTLDRG